MRLRIGKECGGRWFPGIGQGHWDGWRSAFKVRLGFRTFDRGFAVGPLMIWKER